MKTKKRSAKAGRKVARRRRTSAKRPMPYGVDEAGYGGLSVARRRTVNA
jgi:hypothetical protein